jgi:hypothetical protein
MSTTTLCEIGSISSSIPLPSRLKSEQPGSSERLPNITTLLRRLKVGQSALLLRKDAPGLYARAKCARIRIAVRVQDAETVRVWRVE